MSDVATRYVELERQLRRGVLEYLAHGTRVAGTAFGKPVRVSAAPESVEHRWPRIVDGLPDSPAERAWLGRQIRRQRVRYGVRRLRAGSEHWWQRPLTVVRVETVAALAALGHAGLARMLGGTQLELGL